jgi:hypothetical protein
MSKLDTNIIRRCNSNMLTGAWSADFHVLVGGWRRDFRYWSGRPGWINEQDPRKKKLDYPDGRIRQRRHGIRQMCKEIQYCYDQCRTCDHGDLRLRDWTANHSRTPCSGSHNPEERLDSECFQGFWSGRILRAPRALENKGLYNRMDFL